MDHASCRDSVEAVAAVESGFPINSEILVGNLHKGSVVAQRQLCDAMPFKPPVYSISSGRQTSAVICESIQIASVVADKPVLSYVRVSK